jgi:surfeit locus 1 family protein
VSFRPSIALTVILVILAALFGRLGLWQLDRKAEKERLFERFEQAPSLSLEQALERDDRFARVEAYGRFDAQRHFLLDNRIWQGRAGVHVLTPFTLADGTVVLVNRGWLPLPPDRSYLPEVSGDSRPRDIRGRLNVLPTEGPRLGEADRLSADRWPQLMTYFDTASVETALGQELAPWLVQLDPGDPAGFEGRDWKAAVMEPKVHGAYAVQWFSLMIASILIWTTLGIRRGRMLQRSQDDSRPSANGADKE